MQKDSRINIRTDGGSRGNPGLAACAFVAELDGKVIGEGALFLGKATNNTAEYSGVLLALDWLLNNRGRYYSKEVIFYLDSELVVKQLNGLYRIKKPDLQILNIKVKNNIRLFGNKVNFKNIPREENKSADYLVNQELDKH